MLKQCAQKMLEGGGVAIEATQNRSLRDVPLRINDTLFRIGQEALANSVRHARPTRIDIGVYYSEEAVRMTIVDNGRGYERTEEQKGFGVKGMRRRAATISAALEIVSVPGTGTRVTVVAPLPPRRTFQHWTATLWRRIQLNYEQSRQHTYSNLDRG
jgi:signal transduction histidine kinase